MAVKKSELYPLLWEAANKLRGGVEPSRYKDYVLTLLFFKYVSDKYKGQPFSEFIVSEGASFDDLIASKGKSDVGELVDKILQKFLEDNKLQGSLPEVSFNNPDELGYGKELVDRVSGLISIFQNPAMDFKNNRASGDDIIGDAYEYLMMKFAQESGKSKGQFYTPSEVSRVIAKLIGITEIKQEQGKSWTIHDPAAGSGSLLIRAADEAPIDENGNSIITIFAQEKYPDTAGLAKMNFILHNKGTGEIKSGNTLANPAYTDDFGGLRKFDFIVMNPPFSDKDWTSGIKPSEDAYRRFDGYGIPPEKNGDYAWFLHVLKALDSNGKAGIILPHGVLFRGNVEEAIRKEILSKKYIKGIVGLPANLFYGTGIPASIIIIDKENTDKREGIFIIDASKGFKKDGNKNRLREQDIEKIVQTYNSETEIEGYSKFITYKEIEEENEGNLNIPRYIPKINTELPQNINSHLKGGIPEQDVNSLGKFWKISPKLKQKLFEKVNKNTNVYRLVVSNEQVESTILDDEFINLEKQKESVTLYNNWKKKVESSLLNINQETNPKELIKFISHEVLKEFEDAILLDNYDVYDFLLNYWNETMQDDIYILKDLGYEVGREIEYEYAQKKSKDESGQEIKIDDLSKIKSFEGAIIPKEILEEEYFSLELKKLNNFIEKIYLLDEELSEIIEEESGDEGLLINVLNEKGDGVPKTNLNKRLSELESKKVSLVTDDMKTLIQLFGENKKEEMEEIARNNPKLNEYDIRNKNGLIGIGKLKTALKEALTDAKIPEIYADEYNLLITYQEKLKEKEDNNKSYKLERDSLDEKLVLKYKQLTVKEIKFLLFEKKWMSNIYVDIVKAINKEFNNLASTVILISNRYEHTLDELQDIADSSRVKVKSVLERMGYKW